MQHPNHHSIKGKIAPYLTFHEVPSRLDQSKSRKSLTACVQKPQLDCPNTTQAMARPPGTHQLMVCFTQQLEVAFIVRSGDPGGVRIRVRLGIGNFYYSRNIPKEMKDFL